MLYDVSDIEIHFTVPIKEREKNTTNSKKIKQKLTQSLAIYWRRVLAVFVCKQGYL
jgi:hypothetical protein